VSQPENGLSQKRDDLIFELIKRRFDGEKERTNSLDAKAGALVGFVSVTVGLLLGSGSLLSGAQVFKISIFFSHPVLAVIYFIGVATLLFSIGTALTALRVRRWVDIPNVQTLIEKYTTLSYSEVLQRNAGEMAKAVLNAEIQNNNKAKLIECSWYLLIAGLCIVFISVIIFAATLK